MLNILAKRLNFAKTLFPRKTSAKASPNRKLITDAVLVYFNIGPRDTHQRPGQVDSFGATLISRLREMSDVIRQRKQLNILRRKRWNWISQPLAEADTERSRKPDRKRLSHRKYNKNPHKPHFEVSLPPGTTQLMLLLHGLKIAFATACTSAAVTAFIPATCSSGDMRRPKDSNVCP